jgi:hypothetical protein
MMIDRTEYRSRRRSAGRQRIVMASPHLGHARRSMSERKEKDNHIAMILA